jgi:hypothetical protein
MKAACLQAEAALIQAIKAVDNVLHEDGAGFDRPELVTSFMMAAGLHRPHYQRRCRRGDRRDPRRAHSALKSTLKSTVSAQRNKVSKAERSHKNDPVPFGHGAPPIRAAKTGRPCLCDFPLVAETRSQRRPEPETDMFSINNGPAISRFFAFFAPSVIAFRLEFAGVSR